MRSRWLLFLGLFLTSALSSLAMIDTLSVPELIRQSDLVILAEVERQTDVPALNMASDSGKISHATGAPQPLPQLETVVRPIRYFKGASPAGQRLTFVTLGAVSGKPWFEDEPRFPPVGRQVLLFLKHGKASFSPVNMIQGVWPIDQASGKPQGMGFGYSMEDIETEMKNQQVPARK